MTNTSDSNDVHHHPHKVNFMPKRKTCDFSMNQRFSGLRLWNRLYIAKKEKKEGSFGIVFSPSGTTSAVVKKHFELQGSVSLSPIAVDKITCSNCTTNAYIFPINKP